MRLVLRLMLSASIVLSLGYLALNTKQLHEDYIRTTVGDSVVEVVKLDPMGRILGGGTGWAVSGPSGDRYIMTNAHVCDMYEGKTMANIQLPDGKIVKRRIVEISENTDLCLIKGVKQLDSLTLANDVKAGQNVSVVGHPSLMPLVVSYGDIIDTHVEDIPLGIIGLDMKEEQCKQPKDRIIALDFGPFGMLDVCMEEVLAYRTTAVTLPGNSGSPVVDYRGNVIGVLFAGDSEVHWGLVITLDDVRDFLSDK